MNTLFNLYINTKVKKKKLICFLNKHKLIHTLSIFVNHHYGWSDSNLLPSGRPGLRSCQSASLSRPPHLTLSGFICSGLALLRKNLYGEKMRPVCEMRVLWWRGRSLAIVLPCLLWAEPVSWPQSSWQKEKTNAFQRIWMETHPSTATPTPTPRNRDRKRKQRECSSDVIITKLGWAGGGGGGVSG